MRNFTVSTRLHGRLALAAALCALPCQAVWAAQADDIEEVSQPVVQPIKGAASLRLNAALRRVGTDPRDVPALLDAGKASLEVGDFDAAIGFYQRADKLAPNNALVKAGLASAYVRKEDPLSAIPLFEAAEMLGTFDPAMLSERGLAHDLVGDNATAQRFYRKVQTVAANDENARRLALSLAIAGDKRGMETTLAPLLSRGDKAAWRTRTFGYAILGQTAEAEALAGTTMPAGLASAVTPYLRFMPKLTRAQQAAAANFGHFPRAAEIGRDDPRIAAFAASNPVQVASLSGADAGLVPSGQPLGRGASRQRGKAAAQPAPTRVASASAARAPGVQVPEPRIDLVPAPSAAPQAAQARPEPAAIPPASVTLAAAQPQPKPPVAANGTTSGRLTTGALTTVAAEPAAPPPETLAPKPAAAPPVQPQPQPPAPRRDLSDVFADLTPPSREVVASEGAVDIRRLAQAAPAAKPKEPVAAPANCDAKPVKGRKPDPRCALPKECDPKAAKGKRADPNCAAAEAKPAKASQPSRIWVQVATGRNKAALAFDWRKMTREEEATFRSRKPFTAAWGQTNRLLTGPFDSQKAADAYIAQLRKAGIAGAFTWTSPAGQVVDPLPVAK